MLSWGSCDPQFRSPASRVSCVSCTSWFSPHLPLPTRGTLRLGAPGRIERPCFSLDLQIRVFRVFRSSPRFSPTGFYRISSSCPTFVNFVYFVVISPLLPCPLPTRGASHPGTPGRKKRPAPRFDLAASLQFLLVLKSRTYQPAAFPDTSNRAHRSHCRTRPARVSVQCFGTSSPAPG